LLTCDAHVGWRADNHLPAQAVHRPAAEGRELIAELQAMHQQLPCRQQVELPVWNREGTCEQQQRLASYIYINYFYRGL
jgi:hypothetical protein